MKNAVGTQGFTLIEIVITMVVMTILLGLGVVAMGNLQAQARDNERKNDIEAIARGLEQRYKNSNPMYVGAKKGSYPTRDEFYDAMWTNGQDTRYMVSMLPGTSRATHLDPSGEVATIPNCAFGGSCSNPRTETQISDSLVALNGKTRYVYEPIRADGGICRYVPGYGFNDTCIRYNLYWKNEVTGAVEKVESQHQ
jgi:prepilin-type N-terminal cleavage/methylation domain-containing protein